ncbi:hypothetical protein HDR58_09045 [bacterium]|nr:hypothetical protein [bacterium]
MDAKTLIKYFRSIGLEVHTSTKARGHQGFYMKKRIDISKNISSERLIPTLLHEFTHYIHSQLEPFMEKSGGSLEIIFDDENAKAYMKELWAVTNFVDPNSKCEKLNQHKQVIKCKILECESIIKKKYPKFLRSKKFKEFDKYIKKSKAKYLLKYDRVKLISGFLFKREEILSIDNIEKDFTDMPPEFAAYIRLKSYQKKQARVSAKINKLQKYYNKPAELFARLVEGLYIDPETVQIIAPHTCKRFYELLQFGYYNELASVFEIL